MRDQSSVIRALEHEYDRAAGFLGRLRSGEFDAVGGERLVALLRALDLPEGPVNRRVVQLLWMMPIFIEWQKPRVSQDHGAALEQIQNDVVTALEGVLGAP